MHRLPAKSKKRLPAKMKECTYSNQFDSWPIPPAKRQRTDSEDEEMPMLVDGSSEDEETPMLVDCFQPATYAAGQFQRR